MGPYPLQAPANRNNGVNIFVSEKKSFVRKPFPESFAVDGHTGCISPGLKFVCWLESRFSL